MSEENKQRLKEFYEEVVNAHDLSRLDEFLTDDFVEHEELPGIPPTKEGVKQFFAMMLTAFPDVTMSAEDVMAEGDKVWARIVIRGTHKGDFLGIPATGKSVEVQAVDMLSLRGGKAYEHYGVTDMMAMMQQIGAVPAPPAA
jgi:steroid delta-isomerase-like uncharacterized protein